MGVEYVSRRRMPMPLHRAARFVWRKLSPTHRYLVDYTCEDWLAEWRMLARARRERAALVHVLYGDEQLDVLLRHRALLPCPLVATFHHANPRLRKRFDIEQKHLVQDLDAAIVVARSQLPDFQRWLGPDRAFFVPHGVDTDSFCPGKTGANPAVLRLLFVGYHMRDWVAMRGIVNACRDLRLPVEFDAVILPVCLPYFSGCTNVHLHMGITEDRLIELYRGADALLSPMTDATANNAILESLACGTPVISTHVGGVPDYVDETAGWLFPPGEVEGIVALIRQMVENREVARARRAGARAKGLEFDWRQVCDQMRAVYARLVR